MKLEIRTTEEIQEWVQQPVESDENMKRFIDNFEKDALRVQAEEIEKICISLAYQKEGNKLVRKDINHLELFKRFVGGGK